MTTRPKRVREALTLCCDILGSIDDVPEEGEDFASSIEAKTTNIMEWIEANNWVTDAQMDALHNMQSGLNRWLN